jgi:hypothetical protein
MTVLLLHGGVADELLFIVLPLLIFVVLYRWADRKSKRAKAEKNATMPSGPPTKGEPKQK